MQGARAKGYEVDFICMHPYVGDSDPTTATSDLQNKLSSAHNYYSLPIWVTEYAMADFSRSGDPFFGQATEATFATKSVQMLNTLSFVQRYAWLAAIPSIGGYTDTATCTSTGSNTQVGVAYAGAGATIANGVHTLTPQNATGSRLDDANGGTANGNKIQIWQAAGNVNQQWNFDNIGGTTYNIAVNLGPYCIDDNGGASGTATHIWNCQGIPNQKWTATPVQGGYQFKNAAGTCLDVSGGKAANGTVVQSYTCGTGNLSQTWAVN